MGVSFSALFSHSLTVQQVKGLPETFNEKPKYKVFRDFSSVVNTYKAKVGDGLWKWDAKYFCDLKNEYTQLGLLNGPDFFIMQFGRQLCELTHAINWSTFLSDKGIQHSVRKACYELSDIFSNPIYLPDSHAVFDFLEDGNIEDVKEYLSVKDGEPVDSIDKIRYIDYQTGWKGYYIDYFTDFI